MKIICSILSLFTGALAFAQGPISGFMPRAGQLDIAPSYSRESFSRYFGETGELTSRSLDSYGYSVFAEYGVADNQSLILNLPFIHNDGENAGWQDGGLWLKHRNERLEKATGFSNLVTAVGLSLPLSGYGTGDSLSIGRRATTFHGRLLWQFEGHGGWFFQLKSGLDFQIAPLAQLAWPTLVRTGYGARRYYVEAWLEHYRALGGTADETLIGGTNSIWTRAGATLYLPIQPWVGLVAGGAYIFQGRNIGRSLRWQLGAVFRLQLRQAAKGD